MANDYNSLVGGIGLGGGEVGVISLKPAPGSRACSSFLSNGQGIGGGHCTYASGACQEQRGGQKGAPTKRGSLRGGCVFFVGHSPFLTAAVCSLQGRKGTLLLTLAPWVAFLDQFSHLQNRRGRSSEF